MHKFLLIIHLAILTNANLFAATLSDNRENKVGKSIYQTGIGKNGNVITAVSAANTKLKGIKASCANCHRRSGFGSSEGGLLIPSITGNSLFNSREFKYRELKKKSNRPITRKSYDKTSLKRAIQSGIDSNGRKLDLLMPRYNINENDMGNLISYLSTLGVKPAPGVSDKKIYFATIITPDASEKRKSAMLAVLNTYIKAKNSETRFETRRSSNSPWHKKWSYSAYRKWELNVWQLNGNKDSWEEQLNNFYKKQPVFAIVSGISSSTWQPMHDFCNTHEIPCLFPITRLPGKSKKNKNYSSNSYSIYFSEGIALEAKAIAKHISNKKEEKRCGNIVQIIDSSEKTKTATNALIKQLENYGMSAQTLIITKNSPELEQYKRNNFSNNSASCLIHWVDNAVLNNPSDLKNIKQIYITHNAKIISDISALKSDIPIYYSTPLALEKNRKRHLLRTMIWAKKNKISPIIEDVTANTYSAVTLMAKSVKHIRSHFSRDYLIERLEHLIDTTAFHSIYNRYSLGPNQRYASKGVYIIGPINNSMDINHPNNSEWIIP